MFKKILLILLKGYRLFLSPLLGGQCRFYPSCSDYFKRAVERHSPQKAIFMGLKRIFKCHPWHLGGVDLP